jgi:CRISPR-associated protein (TIGR02584 family)
MPAKALCLDWVPIPCWLIKNIEMNNFHKILVSVTGLSPQILTETLYVLAVQKKWYPDKIKLITTREGAKRARLSLLSNEPGWFRQLQQDYQLPGLSFTKDDILIIHDKNHHQLEDIRTPEENQAAADFIVAQISKLTKHTNIQLHVSIAGGRKTMGFFAGYALSLFGRSQDQLSHVLVNEPYESSWEFFYPTPYSKIIKTNQHNLADTKDAHVTLAEIPFVRLRHGLPKVLVEGEISYHQAVTAVDENISPASLEIDQKNRQIKTNKHCIKISPASLALLSVFAREKLVDNQALSAPDKVIGDPLWAKRFLNEYLNIKGEMGSIDKTEKALQNGMDGNYFSYCKSKLHRELKKNLGINAEKYYIHDGNCRPGRYQLKLFSKNITIL